MGDTSPPELEIVVSRYNENLEWLYREPLFANTRKKVTVYNKGPQPVVIPDRLLRKAGHTTKMEQEQLPNFGRESHSYLHHIVTHYDHLADVTIFLPGSCMNEMKQHNTTTLLMKVLQSKDTVMPGKRYDDVKSNLKAFSVGKYRGTSSENQQINMSNDIAPSKVARPFGQWFHHFFGNIRINVVCFTGTFAVARRHILQRPKEFYEKLLESVDNSSNPEDGHFMERSWVAVFHPIEDKCLSYADDRAGAINRMAVSTATGSSSSSSFTGGGGGGALSSTNSSATASSTISSSTAGLSLASMLQMYAKKDVKVTANTGSAISSSSAAVAAAAPAHHPITNTTNTIGSVRKSTTATAGAATATTTATVAESAELKQLLFLPKEAPVLSSSSSSQSASSKVAIKPTSKTSTTAVADTSAITIANILGRKRVFRAEREEGEEDEEGGAYSNDGAEVTIGSNNINIS